jgi:predicted GIY-YIG superfamily endonuclease
MVYKGLSVAFEKKLNFGLVRSNDTVLVSKYNVKKLVYYEIADDIESAIVREKQIKTGKA